MYIYFVSLRNNNIPFYNYSTSRASHSFHGHFTPKHLNTATPPLAALVDCILGETTALTFLFAFFLERYARRRGVITVIISYPTNVLFRRLKHAVLCACVSAAAGLGTSGFHKSQPGAGDL